MIKQNIQESEVYSIVNRPIKVTFNLHNIVYDGKDCTLIIMKDVTSQLRVHDAENKA